MNMKNKIISLLTLLILCLVGCSKNERIEQTLTCESINDNKTDIMKLTFDKQNTINHVTVTYKEDMTNYDKIKKESILDMYKALEENEYNIKTNVSLNDNVLIHTYEYNIKDIENDKLYEDGFIDNNHKVYTKKEFEKIMKKNNFSCK